MLKIELCEHWFHGETVKVVEIWRANDEHRQVVQPPATGELIAVFPLDDHEAVEVQGSAIN